SKVEGPRIESSDAMRGPSTSLGMTKYVGLTIFRFALVRAFHPSGHIPKTIIRLIDLFHGGDGFLAVPHLLVDQAEIVNDLLLRRVGQRLGPLAIALLLRTMRRQKFRVRRDLALGAFPL